MLKGCAISSGSSGNCFYVESYNSRILIDAGISCCEINKRLERYCRSVGDIDGIFISHEHWDHIKSLDTLCKGHRIPVYITQKTLECCGLELEKELVNIIEPNKKVRFKDMIITPFSKSHDAFDPVSFLITDEKVSLGVFTDLGYSCPNTIKGMKAADAIFLESNYDTKMLQQGPYPPFLKRRIQSKKGHLSNYEAALLVMEHANSRLRHVCLSHLSETNNKESIAMSTFCDFIQHRRDLGDMRVSISTAEKESEMITLKN